MYPSDSTMEGYLACQCNDATAQSSPWGSANREPQPVLPNSRIVCLSICIVMTTIAVRLRPEQAWSSKQAAGRSAAVLYRNR